MRTKIIELLDYIQNLREENSCPSKVSLENKGFSIGDSNEAKALGLLEQNSDSFFITDKGYDLLQKYRTIETIKTLKKSIENFDEHSTTAVNSIEKSIKDFDKSSSKINKEMLEHEKTMVFVTKALYFFAILSFILVGFQIYLITR